MKNELPHAATPVCSGWLRVRTLIVAAFCMIPGYWRLKLVVTVPLLLVAIAWTRWGWSAGLLTLAAILLVGLVGALLFYPEAKPRSRPCCK